ncbi:MAG: hypothetical protein RJA22_453 [Verrucomicrobiota bacterium]|jgi:hypothetical protein
MGLFKKQRDPFAQRAAALEDQIAAVEAQIRELNEQASAPPGTRSPRSAPPPSSPQPRLRSTARPQGSVPAAVPPAPPAVPPEPVFEPVDQERLHQSPEPSAPESPNDLGIRRYDLPALLERLKNHFRGPATTNPKLVSYLAAGSIQGLRPLRYEKRVARNRFLVLFILLALALWGLWVMIFRR